MGPHSYSSLKAFKTCHKRFYETKVIKSVAEPQNTESLNYGREFHTAAELYVKEGTPLPEHFAYVQKYLDTLRSIPGQKFCEYKLGLTEHLEPCDFYDDYVWCRGIIDLLVISSDGSTARILDYKTGKSAKYADTSQLELMALLVFKHFPAVRKVKAGLLFVVANDFKPAEYKKDEEHLYWRGWMNDIGRLKVAYNTGIWNPIRSGLCRKHCPVLSCVHNGGYNG